MKRVAGSTLSVVLPYAVFSALWILASDTLLEALIKDTGTLTRLSIYKGWFFILITSAMLLVLMRAQQRARQRVFDQLEARVEDRTRELAEAKNFVDALIDHMPNPVVWMDAELRHLGCNAACEQAFGLTRQQIVGKTVLDLAFMPEPQRRTFYERDKALLGSGKSLVESAAVRFADGQMHQTLYSLNTFYRSDGTPGGLVAVITDVTPLKQAEAALREAKHAAEAADRLKSAFLATMSHELRTPLNSIIGFTGILLQGLPGPLNAEQAKQLGMVQNSARHLLSLINDVLDISKIEAGELTIDHERFELKASLSKVSDIVRPLVEKRGLALRLEIEECIGDMHGDARRVEQILLNLLANAVKFTDAGAITLSARTELIVGEDGGGSVPGVRLSVSDTGVGIRPEHLDELFQPFRQIDCALTRRYEGTGLGLAICDRLSRLMGGRIEVQSRYGEGSRFSVMLPREGRGGKA